jgi:hypothetical protein
MTKSIAGKARSYGYRALFGIRMNSFVDTRPTEARLLEMVFPDHTNRLGILFGGQATRRPSSPPRVTRAARW